MGRSSWWLSNYTLFRYIHVNIPGNGFDHQSNSNGTNQNWDNKVTMSLMGVIGIYTGGNIFVDSP